MGTENGSSESRAGEAARADAPAGAGIGPVGAAQEGAGTDPVRAGRAGEDATAGAAQAGGLVEAQAGAAGVAVTAGASPSGVVAGGEAGTAGSGEAAEPPTDSGTPAALLASGRKLFAKYGFDGASVRAITADAGANLGAVTYHFGSKRALYNRVVERTVAPLVGRVEQALSRPVPVLDRLEGVIRAYFDHFAENPDLPQLMLQEIVLGGGPPEAAGPFMRRIYALIMSAIREGQASGELRPGDPVLLGLSLISQPIFPMLLRRPIQTITGLDMMESHTRERVVAHLMAFARAGLAARPEEVR